MKKMLIMIVLPSLLFASKCAQGKIEVFYPKHIENKITLPAQTKCVSKKDWKAKQKSTTKK